MSRTGQPRRRLFLRDLLSRRFSPTRSNGKASLKQLEGLSFFDLINEAAAAGVVQKRTTQAAHSVRDLRNFVHPAVELREGRLRQVDARAAIALMDIVLEDLG